MSELRDRFERLAGRGSPRGADDVLNAAMRGVPTNEVGAVPDDNVSDLPIIDDDAAPMVTAEHEPRGKLGTLVATFGIAALVGIGALAVASVFGDGGAASPEGAVRQLADAISHKDPLAAVDVLSPTEVRSMRQSVSNVTHRAADLKLVNDASAPLAGVDLSVDNLQLSTQPLADGFTKVTVTGGELSASSHAAQMSKLLQDAMRNADSKDSQTKVELAKLAADSDVPTFVVTVRHDGRWYVSPVYTALEYAREADDGPAAEFGSVKAAANLGADTPDNAVSDALRAWQAGDWERLMALAPPDELPVYDYRTWLTQVARETEPNFTIDKLTTSASVSGDAGTVQLDASGTMGSGEDRSKWQVGGTCPDPWAGWFGYDSSFSQGSSSGMAIDTVDTTELCLAGDVANFVPFGLVPFGGYSGTEPATGPVSIDVVRENGRWFISPVTTVLRALDSTVQHIDERSIYTLLGLAYQLPPDGNITLDQPFTVSNPAGLLSSSVFAFDGAKGQKVVGEITGDRYYASGQIYTADGKQVDYVDFSPRGNGYAYAVTLPETGSYRLVVSVAPKDVELTLWDAKHAPKGLLGSDGGFLREDPCTTTSGGGTSCSSSGSSGITYPATGSGGLTCKVNDNALVCTGEKPMPICATESSGNDDPNCIPLDIAKIMANSSGTRATPTTMPSTVTPLTRGVTATTGVPASVP